MTLHGVKEYFTSIQKLARSEYKTSLAPVIMTIVMGVCSNVQAQKYKQCMKEVEDGCVSVDIFIYVEHISLIV